MSLKIFEFMRRYFQHVLPHGFMKVRHFGFLASNCRVSLDRIRELICALYEILVELLQKKKPPHRLVRRSTLEMHNLRWSHPMA